MYGSLSADLHVAQLNNANLTGANLLGADLSFADLTGAVFCRTTMPDGRLNNSGC